MLGFFATGDIRYGSVERVTSAVNEGSIAVQMVHEYLSLDRPPGGGNRISHSLAQTRSPRSRTITKWFTSPPKVVITRSKVRARARSWVS